LVEGDAEGFGFEVPKGDVEGAEGVDLFAACG
jgi:hypothetical protein